MYGPYYTIIWLIITEQDAWYQHFFPCSFTTKPVYALVISSVRVPNVLSQFYLFDHDTEVQNGSLRNRSLLCNSVMLSRRCLIFAALTNRHVATFVELLKITLLLPTSHGTLSPSEQHEVKPRSRYHVRHFLCGPNMTGVSYSVPHQLDILPVSSPNSFLCKFPPPVLRTATLNLSVFVARFGFFLQHIRIWIDNYICTKSTLIFNECPLLYKNIKLFQSRKMKFC